MSTAALDAYRLRFRKVLEHVDAHLDEALTLERLSEIATFSKFHFHRQFSAVFGVSVHEWVRLVRLKRASYRLAFRDDRILEVALESGYESHEAFGRAFKKATGQTPSDFRERPAWGPWHSTVDRLRSNRGMHMTPTHRIEDVNVVDFEETRVGVLEHRGDPKRIEETIRTFIAWRKSRSSPRGVSKTFNLLYADPEQTPPDEFRLDLCAAIDRPVGDNPFGVVERTIPRGRCAVVRHVGSDDTLGATLSFLYGTWLPQSGENTRDFPLFLHRVTFFPDVPEHEAITDVYLPIE